jgi:hypothetical protein
METPRTVVEWLKTAKHRGFNPRPRYYSHGDYVTYFLRPDRCIERRINSLITVYVDEKTRTELVGCKIKGIKKLMANLAFFATDGKVVMGMLILSAGFEESAEPEKREALRELLSRFGSARLPEEMPQAA